MLPRFKKLTGDEQTTDSSLSLEKGSAFLKKKNILIQIIKKKNFKTGCKLRVKKKKKKLRCCYDQTLDNSSDFSTVWFHILLNIMWDLSSH